MSLRDHVEETREAAGPRFARHGRLALFPGAPQSEQVRCSCDRCGTHLMAASRDGGDFEGVCPVCLSRSMHPVGPHAAA